MVKDRTVRLMFAFNIQLLVVSSIFFGAFFRDTPKYIYLPIFFLVIYVLERMNKNYVDSKEVLLSDEKNTFVDHIFYYLILLSPLLMLMLLVFVLAS